MTLKLFYGQKPKALKFSNDLTYMCLGSVDSDWFSIVTCHCYAQIHRVYQNTNKNIKFRM